jgi:ATP-GRASP peptide maturase of grasp-with-spasm system
MRWLHHFGREDVLRINSDEPDSERALRILIADERLRLSVANKTIELSDIEVIWYRKGRNWLANCFSEISFEGLPELSAHFTKVLRAEENKLAEYIHTILCRSRPTLGSFHNIDLNKLVVLDLARSLGFSVPTFWVTNERSAVQEVMMREPELITKAMSDGIFLFARREEATGYFSYTESLSCETVQSLPAVFPPSLVQQRIDKSCDIRVFFLAGRCYAMAILSQHNARTRVDFRKYDAERPNRCVPYRLPTHLEILINELFHSLALNTGSIDLILDKSGQHYFLEINPVGQFAMVSESCSYQLEREVAIFLIDHAKQRKPAKTQPRPTRRAAVGTSSYLYDSDPSAGC